MLIVGAVLTMASIAWELTRMNPSTGYIVTPWSVRGYESVHGSIIFTIGVLVLAYALITMLETSLQPLWSRGFALLMALGMVGVAIIYQGEEKAMGGGVVGIAVSLVGGLIIAKFVRPYLASLPSTARKISFLGIIVVVALILNFVFLGESRSAAPWVWIAVMAVVTFGLSVGGRNPELSANRMLIFSVTIGGGAIALSAAAARMNLISIQLEESGIAGQCKDVQVTSGYFVALFGMLVAFVGAVSLWAKRRDIIISQERAARQRAAAEASAAEIQAALDLAQQHQREARAGR